MMVTLRAYQRRGWLPKNPQHDDRESQNGSGQGGGGRRLGEGAAEGAKACQNAAAAVPMRPKGSPPIVASDTGSNTDRRYRELFNQCGLPDWMLMVAEATSPGDRASLLSRVEGFLAELEGDGEIGWVVAVDDSKPGLLRCYASIFEVSDLSREDWPARAKSRLGKAYISCYFYENDLVRDGAIAVRAGDAEFGGKLSGKVAEKLARKTTP